MVVKSADDIASIVADNKLGPIANDPSRVLVALTTDSKTLEAAKPIAKAQWGAEKIHFGKHAAYMWCANGILESKMAVALLKDLADLGTTRNWGTLEKIHSMMREVHP